MSDKDQKPKTTDKEVKAPESESPAMVSLTAEQLAVLIDQKVQAALASKGVVALNKESSGEDDVEHVDAKNERKKPVTKEQESFLAEKEPIILVRDNGKYKDDVTVTYNGYNYVIQRGKTVYVPRAVKLILEESYRQQMIASDYSDMLEKVFDKKTQDVVAGAVVENGLPGLNR